MNERRVKNFQPCRSVRCPTPSEKIKFNVIKFSFIWSRRDGDGSEIFLSNIKKVSSQRCEKVQKHFPRFIELSSFLLRKFENLFAWAFRNAFHHRENIRGHQDFNQNPLSAWWWQKSLRHFASRGLLSAWQSLMCICWLTRRWRMSPPLRLVYCGYCLFHSWTRRISLCAIKMSVNWCALVIPAKKWQTTEKSGTALGEE